MKLKLAPNGTRTGVEASLNGSRPPRNARVFLRVDLMPSVHTCGLATRGWTVSFLFRRSNLCVPLPDNLSVALCRTEKVLATKDARCLGVAWGE